MATTELFNRDGKLFAVLTETNDGKIITQEWRYAPDAAPFAGAQPGVTEVNVRLADHKNITAADMDALIEAWRAAVVRPGFRSSTRGGEDGARAFLAQTKGWGTLHATTAI